MYVKWPHIQHFTQPRHVCKNLEEGPIYLWQAFLIIQRFICIRCETFAGLKREASRVHVSLINVTHLLASGILQVLALLECVCEHVDLVTMAGKQFEPSIGNFMQLCTFIMWQTEYKYTAILIDIVTRKGNCNFHKGQLQLSLLSI